MLHVLAGAVPGKNPMHGRSMTQVMKTRWSRFSWWAIDPGGRPNALKVRDHLRVAKAMSGARTQERGTLAIRKSQRAAPVQIGYQLLA